MIGTILSVLKYWKQGGVVLLVLVFVVSLYLAQSRGAELRQIRKDYDALQQTHQAQISAFEKAYKDEKNRYEFKLSQDRKLRSGDWRTAYDSLRQRQSNRSAK